MKIRLAAVVVPLLLLFPGATAAQSGQDCVVGVALFDAAHGPCVVSLVPDDPSKAAALKAAQARWDGLAKELGASAALLWLGPRPRTVADVWWPPAE
jgi:hypothetical protein